MSTHKSIDKICCIIVVLSLIITVLFMNAKSFGVAEASKAKGYEARLFDTSTVHTMDIVMEDWDSFIATCTNEEYALCSVVIDNEAYKNVAIRAKGNTSIAQVENYGNDRYSFKIEFDHYDSTKNYYGLDKICLNNIIQDNTYMKDFLTYQMMQKFGADAPLCSYVNITVNGENWGLYLAVESVEESFLERNYGSDYGELYKPDSMSMGGVVGKPGEGMTPPDISKNGSLPHGDENQGEKMPPDVQNDRQPSNGEIPQMPNNESPTDGNFQSGDMPDKVGFGDELGSDDVTLIYSDDEYDSYTNIFDNSKTDISDADKDRLIKSLKQLNSNENIEKVVNVDEVIRYFVVHNFVCNFDSYTGSMIHNYYLYEEDGQLSMIPWDYNLAFGGFQDVKDAASLVNYPIDSPVSSGTVESRPMLAWIFNTEEYTELYHKYFAEFISTFFDSGYFSEMMDSVKEMIAPFVESDTTKFCTYEEFQTGVDTLKEFCLLRAESVSGQLDGTIASTSGGQTQGSTSLIDASSINVSDMGSMGNVSGGGMDTPNGQGNVQDKALQNATAKQDNSDKSGRMYFVNSQAANLESWIMIGVSCLALIAATLIALCYKKRS